MADQWHLSRDGQQYGPYAWQDLVSFGQQGQLSGDDLIWSETTGGWVRADTLAGLLSLAAPGGTAPASRGRRRRGLVLGSLALLALVAGVLAVLFVAQRPGKPAGAGADGAVAAPALGQNLAGTTLALDTGGSLLIPHGALPAGAGVQAQRTTLPALPDDLQALGEAVEIIADTQPTAPVLIRLPLPLGTDALAELAIVRVAPDGSLTLLMAETQGNDVVAFTPGFSVFVVGQLLKPGRRNLVGGPTLLPGQQDLFSVEPQRKGHTLGATWTVSGGATIVSENESAAVVQAGPQPGSFTLTYECIDLDMGRRWYAARSFDVTEELGSNWNGFRVSVVTDNPAPYADEQVRIGAALYGDYELPINWQWDLDDGAKGQATSDAKPATLALPAHVFAPRSEPYVVKVSAKDARGRKNQMTLAIRAIREPLTVALEGPRAVPWDGEAYGEYRATATGGTAPFSWTWELAPYIGPAGGEARANEPYSGRMYVFREPGEYRVAVAVGDAQQTQARVAMPVRVTGGEPLSTRILDLPSPVEPGKTVEVVIQVRGGALVVAGEKGGYAVEIDWGVRGPATAQQNLGSDRTPDQGVGVTVSHTYKEPGAYTVSVVARDATGSTARAQGQITVTDEQAAVTPQAPADNTPPEAEDLVAETEAGVSVAITLKGSDRDGDTLAYVIVDPPNHGVLTAADGRPLEARDATPFLLYQPEAGFAGRDAFGFQVDDGRGGSATGAVEINVIAGQAAQLRWVLEGPPIVNWAHEPDKTDVTRVEPRFAGTFTNYDVSAGSITMSDRWVDNGWEGYNVTVTSTFDAPPATLLAGEEIELSVQFSHGGTLQAFSPGAQFWFSADQRHSKAIQPAEVLGYYPWAEGLKGANTKTWTLTAPAGAPGDTFEVWAGWWNCAACNVHWVYRAE